MEDAIPRRSFPALTGLLPDVPSAQQHAHQSPRSPATKLEVLSAEQAAEIEAVAAQIIPSDDSWMAAAS